ncbi:LuxR C-terminal-related transcriptional regulator [Sphingosinicella sp. LY1275]|uniref:LuxR C-terminal-related transcriptional regulator n=1 Tax=Sphingosinicella sp. LY1275 TaxID=3095379 RepID=UPI002ADECE13|nr:LuxR C-terminal-related transcriptional regulator [Sphingosinicella sp. LY1275]MEA1015283.1 LuxR C-terminal-related transcriptional regulator [Sphingosinicella sp. LY1275]
MSNSRPRSAAPRELLKSLCSSPIATVVTDPHTDDNPIVAVNSAFERLTGYVASEIVGRNCRFLAGPEIEQEGTAILRDAIREARPVLVELLNYKRDGTPFRNAVMIAPIFDADGKLECFVGSQMEIAPAATAPPAARTMEARALVERLTPRQRQVLREMTRGYRNKQIAARLELSEKTVKMHRSALLAKLQAVSSTDAVRIAVEAGL